jgi:ATP-dependent Clp protease ATP-binding subunit ClpC
MEKVKQAFRPEFLNRVDEMIVFHALTHGQIKGIVDLLLHQVESEVRGHGIKIEASEAVREHLAHEGFNRVLGARPLRRAIQRLVEDPLSERLLSGEFAEGDIIHIEMRDHGIEFTKGEPLPALVA